MLRAQSLAIKLNTAFKNVNIIRSISPPAASGTKKIVFAKYFLVTNLTISSTASGLGDFIEQMFEIFSKYQKNWDKTRTAKMAFTGKINSKTNTLCLFSFKWCLVYENQKGLPVGLICHHFYIILDKYFIEKSIKVILQKIVLCQIVCSPLCIITFYLTLGRLNSWSSHKTYNNILEKGSQVFFAEWMVW